MFMEISEQDLRVLVRDAIARNGRAVGGSADPTGPVGVGVRGTPGTFDRMHASHGRLPLAGGSEGGGLCLIEPAVRCNHCGYCQSLGH
jgi:hypothetical protein